MLLAESLLATNAAVAANYIEDVFSTYLYTGNGSTGQTITNGIDLSGKGGMVWIKSRSNATKNTLSSTASSNPYKYLSSNLTDAQSTSGYGITSFNSSGFFIEDVPTGDNGFNGSGYTYASWTFRKQAKFFDVVTFTAPASGTIVVPHNLGSTPGCVITKATGISQFWVVNHRSLSSTEYLVLNDTAAKASAGALTYTADANNVTFSAGYLSASTAYVMYLFAHDAGGFGATGSDNVISCGSYTGNGSTTGPTITLGYEPQFLLVKQTNAAGTAWRIQDNMRSLNATGTANLFPNYDFAESASPTVRSITPTATGFFVNPSSSIDDYNASGGTYIYIAIRRGPMKTPTTGTSVFGLSARTGTGANATVTGGQTDDAVLIKNRGSAVASLFSSRLTGTGYLVTSSTAAEVAAGTTILQANPWDVMDGVKVGTTSTITNASANTYINYLFRRAPGFFDVVCYTGTGANRTVSHNLGVAPEMMIVKRRDNIDDWNVYHASYPSPATGYFKLNTNAVFNTQSTVWNDTNPTSTVFSVGTNAATNASGGTYVAYLFATVAGVSKVGSYTGTGTTNQINCGFTGGARFVLIKRTDSTGDWYVWDSARGIVSGNDSYLLLNSTAAEVTNTDYIDTYSAGFEISSTAPAAINANGGTFIFWAVA